MVLGFSLFGSVTASAFGPGTAAPAPALLDVVRGAAGLADDVDDDGVSWAPPLSAASTEAKPKPPQAYDVRDHRVETRLKSRNTAVVNVSAVVDAPHDVMFDLLADPHQHERIFDAIESARAELLEDTGTVKKWKLDYRAKWKFWKVGGVCDNRLWMTTDREKGTVSFELREPGFLRQYEGVWRITGPHGGGPGAAEPSTPPSPTSVSRAISPSPSSVSLQRPSLDASTPRGTDVDSAGSSAGTTPRHTATAASAWPSPFSSGLGGGFHSFFRGAAGGMSNLMASINNPVASFQALHRQAAAGVALPQGVRSHPIEIDHRSPSLALQPSLHLALPDDAAAAAAAAAARYPTTIRVEKLMSPKVAPPYPLNQVLKGHAAGQVQDMLDGLLFATAKAVEEGGDLNRAAAASKRSGGKH